MTLHARIRARERYGVELTEARSQTIVRQIERQQAVLLARQPNGRLHFLVMLDGRALRIVYDPVYRAIVTALPPHARNPKQGEEPFRPDLNAKFANRRRKSHA